MRRFQIPAVLASVATCVATIALTSLFSACRSAPAPTTPARTVPSASATPSLAADARGGSTEAPRSAIDSMRKRGSFAIDPIAVPAAAPSPAHSIVFIGTPELVRAAWHIVPDAPKDPQRPIVGFPIGSRIVATLVRAPRVHLLLESTAVYDQPAGMRAVATIDGNGQLSSKPVESDSRDIAAIVDAPQSVDPSARGGDGDASYAVLKQAAASESALGAALLPRGVDLFDIWQHTFTQHVERIIPSKLTASPYAPTLLELVRDAVEDEACSGLRCVAEEHGTIQMASVSNRLLIERVNREARAARSSGRAARRIVSPAPTTTATESAALEHVRDVSAVLREAPLLGATTKDASIGIAITDSVANGPALVLREGSMTRLFPLLELSLAARSLKPRYEVGFADVDGDGRTDAIVRMTAENETHTQVYLAPPASVQATVRADIASSLAVMDAQSIDAAVTSALAIPARGLKSQEACALLSSASTLAGFKKIATPDARVLTFNEPNLPTLHAKVAQLAKLTTDDVQGVGGHCPDLDCDRDRPVCTFSDGSYSEFYFFTWIQNQLKLAGAAFYSGD